MIFHNALTTLGAPEQAEVRRRLTLIAGSGRTGSHVEQNLFTESRLPSVSALDILNSLLGCVCELGELKNAYQDACHRHILKGPHMKGRRPRVLGRAIAREQFKDMLIKLGVFVSAASADAFFRRLRRMSLSKQKRRLHRIPLGRHVVWATFCADDRKADPFSRLPNDANQIQDALGFPLESRGDDVFLFTYSATNSVTLLFPTIADAEWNGVFCPAPDDPKVEYGLTRPSEENPLLACQPEVVHHDRVTCACLVTPLNYLPAIMPSI
jgi:hypothetical protein